MRRLTGPARTRSLAALVLATLLLAALVLGTALGAAGPAAAADPTPETHAPPASSTPSSTTSRLAAHGLTSLLQRSPTAELAQRCCKTCRKGKACGDSCIARTKTCRVGPGCACNAR